MNGGGVSRTDQQIGLLDGRKPGYGEQGPFGSKLIFYSHGMPGCRRK